MPTANCPLPTILSLVDATLRRAKKEDRHFGKAFTAHKWFFMPALFFRSVLRTQNSELSFPLADCQLPIDFAQHSYAYCLKNRTKVAK